MTLNEHKKHIDELIKKGHGDRTVVTSSDDEGNSYSDVFYAPSILNVKDLEYNGDAKGKVVCLN